MAPAVLNAANEVTVAAFLSRRIAFGTIAVANAAVLEEHLAISDAGPVESLEDIVEADEWARRRAREFLGLDALPQAAEAG